MAERLPDFRRPVPRPIGAYVPPPPVLRTPDGLPAGWRVRVGSDGVPVLERDRG